MSAAASNDPYGRIADLYEAEHRGWTDDLDLYQALAARAGGPVLELGCGTGRVAIALAEAGYEVLGIETSEAMLDIARAKVRGRKLPITFAHGDMRRFSSRRAFGLVVCALNTLLHLQTADDVRDTLVAASRVLRPGGLLAFDIINPAPDLLAMRDGVVRRQSTFAGPEDTEVTHFVSWDIDPVAQTIETAHYYDWLTDEGLVRRRTTSFRLRYLERAEVEGAIRAAGFSSVELYGNSQLDPFDPCGDRMVVLAANAHGQVS